MTTPRIIIVGAGIIGLSCAYELSSLGAQVTLFDPRPAQGATNAAAGMLGAVSEIHFGETDHTPLLLAAAAAWPAFARNLEEISGQNISFSQSGTLLCGVTQSDRAEIDRLAALHVSLGLDSRDVDRNDLGGLEPSLSPRITRAHFVSGDHHVDGRAVASAMACVLRSRGVSVVTNRVIAVEVASSNSSVTDDMGTRYEADHVVVAAGSLTNSITGLEQARVPMIRPVKGEILRLFDAHRSLRHVIRAIVSGRSVYLVPRPNGEVVIGATSLESADGETVRAGGVFELLSDARSVFPGLDELAFVEANTGLRPARESGSPFITRYDGQVTVLGGHYRNGILLAPITASVAAGLVLHGSHSQEHLFEVFA